MHSLMLFSDEGGGRSIQFRVIICYLLNFSEAIVLQFEITPFDSLQMAFQIFKSPFFICGYATGGCARPAHV